MGINTLANVVAAGAAVIIALGGVITALTVLVPILRRTKTTEAAVMEVHVLVNQQRTNLENYQRALIRALKDADIIVPIDQSASDPAATLVVPDDAIEEGVVAT